MNIYEEDHQSRIMFQDTSLILGAAFIVITLILVVFQRIEFSYAPVIIKKSEFYKYLEFIKENASNRGTLNDNLFINNPIYKELAMEGTLYGFPKTSLILTKPKGGAPDTIYIFTIIDTMKIQEYKGLKIAILNIHQPDLAYFFKFSVSGDNNEFFQLDEFMKMHFRNKILNSVPLGTGKELKSRYLKSLNALMSDNISILATIEEQL